MTTWESKAEENKVRERSSSFAEKFSNLPEVFGLEQLAPLYSNKRSAQTAVCIMIKKGVVEKVGKNSWKKIVTNVYDSPIFK